MIEEFFWGCEIHSVEKIRHAIEAGLSATELIGGRLPIDILIEMYTRSDRFGDCLTVLIEAGAQVSDQSLLAVLRDDPGSLQEEISRDAGIVARRYNIPCAFIPLEGATLLHVAAEFGRRHCVPVLLEAGADPDARAGTDAEGFGGQTPIFHTVNTHNNYCRPVMDILLDAGASVDIHVKGLRWGLGMEWETLIPEVNPISYAMMGNLPQFHRDERQIADNIRALLRYKYGVDISIPNVPNAYVARSKPSSDPDA